MTKLAFIGHSHVGWYVFYTNGMLSCFTLVYCFSQTLATLCSLKPAGCKEETTPKRTISRIVPVACQATGTWWPLLPMYLPTLFAKFFFFLSSRAL